MRTVQADSCLISEQIDILSISVGGQEGGGEILGRGPKFTRVMSSFFVGPLPHTTLIKKKEPLWFWAPQKESLLEKTYKQTMRFSDHEEASEC
jgi:hypothetical protein